MWECWRCHEQNEDGVYYCKKCREPRWDLGNSTDSNDTASEKDNITPSTSEPTSGLTGEQDFQKNNDSAYKFGIAMCVLGIILGAILLIAGIVLSEGSYGADATLSASFGGDFYTYIYQATQNAANNLQWVNWSICDLGNILKTMTCGMGGFVMLFSLITMSKMMSRKKYENAVLRQNDALYALLEKYLKEEPEEKRSE